MDRSRLGIWALTLLGGFFGAALIALAVPRIAAHSGLLPFGPVREALDQGTEVTPARLAAAHEALARAGAWLPADASIARDRARVARRLAGIADKADMPSGLPGLAAADLQTAAAAAPADAFNWALLADAQLAAGAPAGEVLSLLRLARLTGPRKASALLPQFGIAMRHWGAMPDEMRAHALSDAAAFWRRGTYRPLLLESYLDAGFAARAAFRAALAADPRLLAQFDRVLSGRLQRR